VGEVVTIGFIRRPHGLRGEVVVTDLSEGFFEPGPGLEVVLLGPNSRTETAVESWRRGSGGVRVKFACFEGRDAAEGSRDWRVAVAAEALPRPPADVYYEFELVGLAVETTAGDDAGKVVGLYAAGPHDVLIIEAGGREFDIPFVKAHVADVQRGTKIIITPYGEE
jgi:16S rRNA processing protein RimM